MVNNLDGRLAAAALALVALATPRLSLAACPVTTGTANDLRIVGSSIPQRLLLEDDGTTIKVFLDCNGDGDYTDVPATDLNGAPFTGIETLNIIMGGRDTIEYLQTGPWSGVVRGLNVTLGAFNNTFKLTLNNTISGHSSLTLDLQGSPFVDNVTLDCAAASLTGSALLVYADLGSGSDVFTLKEPQATSSKVDVVASLGLGANRISVESAAPVSASTLRVDVEGSQNDVYTWDTLTTSFGSTLDNGARLLLNANLRDAADILEGRLLVSGLEVLNGSELRMQVSGNGGNDHLTVGDGSVAGPATIDGLVELVLRGGGGRDNLDVNLNGIVGSGTLRVREHGGVYPDNVLCTVLTDPASANNLDFVVQGGRSNDTLFGGVVELGASNTYSPGGSLFLDGGLENDLCLTLGNGPVSTTACEP